MMEFGFKEELCETHVCVQSPTTMASCDGDSDSSHATGSCSPGDSIHDVPRARPRRRQRVSTSLFPTSSADAVGSVPPPPRTADERHSAAAAAVISTPLTGWCPSPLLVDRRSAVLPELLGSDAYCRLAAAAAASIAGIYWGRRCDEKAGGVELTLPWQTAAAAAAAAGFSLPALTPNYASTTDSPVSGATLDRSSWLALTSLAPPTDGPEAGKVVAASPDRSGSASSVDDLPLDLSPVSKRARADSPLTNGLAADDCSI